MPKTDKQFLDFVQSQNDEQTPTPKQITVRDLRNILAAYEDDSVVLMSCWDQEKTYGYNYACIAGIDDEYEHFKNLGKPVKVLTKEGKIVGQLKLRGDGRRFVVLS